MEKKWLIPILIHISIAFFFGVVFVQSSLDKILNWKSNKSFFQDFFKNTFLRNFSGENLLIITICETIIAILSLALLTLSILNLISILLGSHNVIFFKTTKYLSFILSIFASLVISLLILGQRIAQDYISAARTTSYQTAALIAVIASFLILFKYG